MWFQILLHCVCVVLFVLAAYGLEEMLFVWYADFTNATIKLHANFYMPALHYLMQFSLIHAFNFWLLVKRQTIKEKELRALAYQAELNALKAQIEPHFLFNTLNSISATVTKEQEETRVLIAKLADTFRYALRSTQVDHVLLSDELEFIRTYLELERERFIERLQINIAADKGVENIYIPPMLLQPLVENALKHGIEPSIKGGCVSVVCRLGKEYVYIEVSDTGMGYEGDPASLLSNGKGVGLSNTAMRLEKLYNEKITITRNQPSGLKFSFKIPTNSYGS